MNRKITIICDFDGTVSERDVGHNFFGTFIMGKERWLDLIENWKLGLISSKECLEREMEWVEAGVEELDSFVSDEKLDPYFKDFVDFCNRCEYNLLIVSDGLDYYIDLMLMKTGLGYLDYRANKLVTSSSTLVDIKFPYYNSMECTMCGNCKRYHLEELKDGGFYTVYVGNGYSDRCPAQHADLVLAKGDLLDYCKMKKIDYVPFKNFRDVEFELTERLVLPE